MIRKILMLTVCCLWFGVAYSQIHYDITGTYENGAGKKVHLVVIENGNIEGVEVDSAVVANDGSFILRGEVKKKMCAMISTDGLGYRAIFLDGQPMKVQIKNVEYNYENPSAAYVLENETKDQLAAKELVKFFGDDYVRVFTLGGLELGLARANTESERDTITDKIKRVKEARQEQLNMFLDLYHDSDVAPFFVETNMLKFMTVDEISFFYDHLTDRVKQTDKGKEIGERVVLLKKLAPGSPAPEFELTTPEGEKLALKDLRGHIVLLDFWASWCGPCIDEMPNVKEIYTKYHKQGLEIVGISMDTNKTLWEGAIKRVGLPWRHVSSLKGMNRCPVAKMYQVVAIPKLYIIDKDGKIIDKDLRGKELKNKMDELFQK